MGGLATLSIKEIGFVQVLDRRDGFFETMDQRGWVRLEELDQRRVIVATADQRPVERGLPQLGGEKQG